MLSTTAKYAVRALAELAGLPEGSTLLGKDLARRVKIPANYLSKILWTLGSAGFIDATRGSKGGYRLRRKAEEIRLVEVVDLFDKERARSGCFMDRDRPCSDAAPCSAHRAWHEVGAAYTLFLESTTLADITTNPA